jgi:hypothetical protein
MCSDGQGLDAEVSEFAGRVAHFQQSTRDTGYGQAKTTLQVWDFDIEHVDDSGNVDRAVSVQMAERSFDGRLRNDEDVRIELPRGWREGTTAQVRRIWSVNRKVWIKGSSDGIPLIQKVLIAIGFVLILAFMAFGASQLIALLPIGTATVPNVVGFSNVHAGQVLGNAGFESTVETEHSSKVPFGQVIRTDPAAGAIVSKGTIVVTVISSGP